MKTLKQYIKEEENKLTKEAILTEKAGEVGDIIMFKNIIDAKNFIEEIKSNVLVNFNDMESSAGSVFMSVNIKETPKAKKLLGQLLKKYKASSIS